MEIADEIHKAVRMSQKKPKTKSVPTDTFYDLMLRRIRLHSRIRIAWLRKLWMEANAGSNGDEAFNQHSEVDGYLNNNDSSMAEATWLSQDKGMQSQIQELEKIENHLQKEKSSRLVKLVSIFGLSGIEKDIVQTCLALTIDPNLGRVYAYLQDHNGRTYVSSQLVARLFHHGPFIVIGSSSPLVVWGLIREMDAGKGEPQRLELDPFISNWLLGAGDMDSLLTDISRIQTLHPALPQWPVSAAVASIKNLMNKDPEEIIRMFLEGIEGTGRRSFAAIIASKFGKKLLTVSTQSISATDWPMVYMRAQRQALLHDYALCWEGEASMNFPWAYYPPVCKLQFIIGEADEAALITRNGIDLRMEVFPIPIDEAPKLWKKFLPASASWSPDMLKVISRRHHVTIGNLVTVSKKNITTPEEASDALRGMTRQGLGDLAKQLHSSFTWEDLVVPDALQKSLEDFHFEASERALVWEQAGIARLFPQGKGLMALFTGSPGTGKTMAAQVIANSLQLDLFRIDLSSMVSKYIGDTSKNIKRILSRAERMNVLLLFDEADALFGKRTEIKDAHDRYSNTDTNYLLQAIEEYQGIAILASNNKSNMDIAFSRRIRFLLDFPKPDAAHRLLLWRNLINELTEIKPEVNLDYGLKRLADQVAVTGAQIKLAVLSAIFIARKEKKSIGLIHLVQGLKRELAKEGMPLGKQAQEMMKQVSN